MSNQTRHASVLTVRCSDRIGIVSAVATFLSRRGLSIEESDQFHDRGDGAFYMRVAFAGPLSADAIRSEFADMAEPFRMDWTLQTLGGEAADRAGYITARPLFVRSAAPLEDGLARGRDRGGGVKPR